MKFNNFINQCKNDDVCSYKNSLFKIGRLKEVIIQVFEAHLFGEFFQYLKERYSVDMIPKVKNNNYNPRHSNLYYDKPSLLFEDGVDFSILRANSQGWQTGKLKINISIEFIPDELEKTESPLDEIRQEIKQN